MTPPVRREPTVGRLVQAGSAGIQEPQFILALPANIQCGKETPMRKNSRFKKRLYTSAVALGLALGSVGVAAAVTGNTASDGPTDNGTEVQEPAYTGSVQAPADDGSLSEAEDATRLEGSATITADQAAAAAAVVVPGNVQQVELESENGSIVYSVDVVDKSGNETEVKVDAGDGTVLEQESGDEKTGEADNENEQHESENEGQNDAAEGQGD